MAGSSSAWFKSVVIFSAGTLFGAISAVQVAPRTKVVTEAMVSSGQASALPTIVPTGGASAPTNGRSAASSVPASRPGLECAPGRNGGKTDVGVTATSIELATTVVQSGLGQAFLGDVQYAMEAVRNKVNRAGGICGRLLNIKYVDDGWDADRGSRALRNLIKSGVFAIPVAPSSEGLRVVIDSGDIDKERVPVVGTDGMLDDQYRSPWVWPVAAATTSTARLMAIDAYKRGARRFSIVFDKNYRFGLEGAAAFNSQVRRLTGGPVAGYNSDNNCQQSFCGILAGQSSYSTEIQQFEPGDYVAMFLEPTTALTWMSTPGAPTAATNAGNDAIKYGIGGAQPLFTRAFAKNCQAPCDQMQVWTAFKPPIEGYANDAQVRTYVADLRQSKLDADAYNAFAQGGYVGMSLFVEALKAVGPELTRERLRAVLGTLSLRTGLTVQSGLSWGKTHFANATMQAFTIQYKGTFSGWRTGQIERDPTPSLGIN